MDQLILDLIEQSRRIKVRLQDFERRVKILESGTDDLGSVGVL